MTNLASLLSESKAGLVGSFLELTKLETETRWMAAHDKYEVATVTCKQPLTYPEKDEKGVPPSKGKSSRSR